MFTKTRKAFTLLELVVILVAMGILSTLGYQKFSEVMLESKSVQLANQLNKIEVAINKYYAELGTFPIDTNWLVASTMDPAATGFDSLALKVGEEEDADVKEYWSGPYITDMPTLDNSGVISLKATFGDDIAICAEVEGDELSVSTAESKVTPCNLGTLTEVKSFINTFIIKGVDPQAIKFLFRAVNGREMTENEKTHGNALKVAKGIGSGGADKLGVPSRTEYATNPYLIYRFAANVQRD